MNQHSHIVEWIFIQVQCIRDRWIPLTKNQWSKKGVHILGKFDCFFCTLLFFCKYNFEIDWVPQVNAVRKFVPWPALRWGPKRAAVCDLCSLYYTIPKIGAVQSDMANSRQMHSSWYWPMWQDMSPRDGSVRHCRLPWWQPMTIIQSCDRLRDWNCFASFETYWKWKRGMVFTPWCCFQLNWISISSRTSDWLVHSESYLIIRLEPLRWVPFTHSAGRRGLNLLTAVRPVELVQWRHDTGVAP